MLGGNSIDVVDLVFGLNVINWHNIHQELEEYFFQFYPLVTIKPDSIF